ncbi:MAG: glycoside hydrolase [Segetibacter sp.]|nr:glycoside hydrolase [Segetibacter sp.]
MVKKFLAIASSLVLLNGTGFAQAGNPKAQNFPVVKTPTFKKDTINIVSFGAKADGVTLNTKSINDAINASTKKGGGVVVIPRGLWLTGPVVLKSNVNLHLQSDAVLLFTPDFNQYKLIETNWEGLAAVRNESPISATNAVNIGITGFGIIDGSGDAWRMVKKDKLTESNWKRLTESGGFLSDDKKSWFPSQKSLAGSKVKLAGVMAEGRSMQEHETIKDFLRPNLMVLTKCKGILLEGITVQNSPAWCLHPLMSENIIVRNVNVKNPWYAQNGDGIDLESCKNVIIENSVFDVGDDGICIKSGRDAEGRKRNMPTENVLIRNSVVYHAHGGFVIGSEMSGGARNIWVENCSFIGTDIGLRFKTTRGRGGIVENIHIKNINMKDIVGEAILFDMYYAAQDPIALAGEKREPPKVQMLPVSETTPQFRNIDIKNVVCNGAAKGIFVRGIPEMNVQNILMEDLVLQADKGVECTEGSNIRINNLKLITKETNPVINVHNSNNITFNKVNFNEGAEVLLNVTGEKTKNIQLLGTDVKKAKQGAAFSFGATSNVLEIK